MVKHDRIKNKSTSWTELQMSFTVHPSKYHSKTNVICLGKLQVDHWASCRVVHSIYFSLISYRNLKRKKRLPLKYVICGTESILKGKLWKFQTNLYDW